MVEELKVFRYFEYNMRIKRIPEPEVLEDDIKELLIKTDDEFYPPLSERKDTKQSNFETESEKTVNQYLNNLLEQNVIACFQNDKMIGILSFTNSTPDTLDTNETIYLSTIVISPKFRRMGASKSLIGELKHIARRTNRDIYSRTWSTNTASQSMFESEDFDMVKRIDNDRDKGVDSMYYYWEV